MKYIFILILILSLTAEAFCQGQDSSRVQNMIALGEYDGIKVSVDNNFFTSKNDSIVSLLYKNFIENIPIKYWKFETIKPASNLSQIIKENYDIYDNGENSFDETYQLLKEAIATKSRLKNENNIIAGDSLLLPPVPSKRNRLSNDEISKLFEEFEVKTAVPYVALDSFGKPITKIKWHSINIKQQNVLKTLSQVSNIDKIKYFDFMTISNSSDSIYIADIDFFNFKEAFTSLEIKSNLNFSFNSKTIDKVKTINDEIGEYIIVDDFSSNNNCLHGDKVYSVVENILTALNAHHLLKYVKKQPISFFDNEKQAYEIVTKLYQFKGNIPGGKDKIKRLKKATKGTCKSFCIPEEYFQILYEYVVSQNPDVISMSLAVNCKKPITSYLNYEFENTFIFAAVHNTFGSIEKILEPMNGNYTKAEPTFSFLKRPKGPYYLVGGLDENGIIKSLFSDKGENILTVGNGAWSFDSSCAPQAFGSSFATPEIAVYVWLMKNYFKNKGEKLNTENIALRLLLSADLNTTCLGKFSSAGVPNLNKMMAGGKGFVVKNDSIITLTGIKRASSIRYSLFDQLPSFTYLSNDIKSDNNIYGIGLIENSILIFDKNKMLWKKVESVESIDIELQYIDGKKEVLKSYEDLINTGITQIVTYN